MPRKDGNKNQKQDLKKMELTLRNIIENERFLAENAGELTPHQLKDVREHLAAKKKFLLEAEGTIRS